MRRSPRSPFVLAVLVLGVGSVASAHHIVAARHGRSDEVEGWGPAHGGACDSVSGRCREDVDYGGPSSARVAGKPAMAAVHVHHHHSRAFASRRSGAFLPFVPARAGGLLTAPSPPPLAAGAPPDLSPSSYPRRL